MHHAMRHAALFAVVVILLNLQGCLPAMQRAEGVAVDTSAWTTHAVGRFLITLPPNAQLKYTTRIWGADITWRKDMTPEAARREAEQAIAKYKAIPHEEIANTTQFIDSFPLGDEGIAVHIWEEPYITVMSKMNCYFVSQDAIKNVFFYSPSVGVSRFADARQKMEQMAAGISARDEWDPLPTEPGFAFEGGFSRHTGEWRAERAIVAFTLPSYPGIKGYFAAYGFGTVQKFMFEEEGVEERLAAIASRITTLRKGNVDLHGIPGQELCAAATEDGRRKYNFDMEAPAQGKDIGRPMLILNIFSDEEASGDGFDSDAEAVAVWNAIRDSIRLRPGAV
jgi:hypothetical protein